MTSKLAIGKSSTSTDIITYSNGNTKSSISITGAYPFELIHGIANLNSLKSPNLVFSKTYGTGAFGFNAELVHDFLNKKDTISLSGSIGGIGFSGSFTLDKDYNIISTSGFAGIQIIGGDKTVVAGIPYGADGILRLGLKFDENGIKFTSDNQASIGFIMGDVDVSAQTGVDVIDFNKNQLQIIETGSSAINAISAGASFGFSPCFATSTPILTPTGEVLIQDIAVGDSVLAFDGFGELVPSKAIIANDNTPIFMHKKIA